MSVDGLRSTSMRTRASVRAWLRVAMIAVAAFATTSGAFAAEPVKGEVRVTTDAAGFARMVFRLDESVDAKVRVSGAIVVIEFKKPVAVAVDRISSSIPDYVSAARIDPDGTAIRIALAGRFRVNAIPAAERFYVDLLPEPWVGQVPGLPQDVVDELAARARQAELALRKQGNAKNDALPPVRVKVVKLPTATRYVFDLPSGVNVIPEAAEGKFKLHFDQPTKWDLGDAKATLPSTLASIDTETEFGSAAVVFALKGLADAHSFREENSFVVDIKREPEAGRPVAAAAGGAEPAITTPETVPVKDMPVLKDAPPLKDATPAAAPKSSPPAITPPATAPPATPPAVKAEPAPSKDQSKDQIADKSPAKEPVQQATKWPAVGDKPVSAPSVTEHAAAAGGQGNAGGTQGIAALTVSGTDFLRVTFPFAEPTPAAVFRRGDMLWMIFDTDAKVDVASMKRGGSDVIRSAAYERGASGAGIVRIRLARPQLISLEAEGTGWSVKIGDSVSVPSQPLPITRNVTGNKRGIVVPLDRTGMLHRLTDPDLGTRLMVVTALGPARGVLKPQDFVELRVLQSVHGVVVQPLADDLMVDVASDLVTLSRPGGLSLSAASLAQQQLQAPSGRDVSFDPAIWDQDRKAPYLARQADLIGLAASAPDARHRLARFNLARFYLAREMAAEAKAVLDVALADQKTGDEITGSILRAVANVMLNRPEEALKELSEQQIGNQQDAPVWRAVARSQLGRWSEAHAGFKTIDDTVRALPGELQRLAMMERLRTALEVSDFAGATRIVNELDTMGVPTELEAPLAVLNGRLAESLGRKDDALAAYRAAAASSDRRSASQGRLREIDLLFRNGSMPRAETIHDLETLTTVWRGDETETQGLHLLARLYTEDGRFRDAFHVMRTALLAHPNSDMTRKIQDEAAITFDSLFLGGKGDALQPVEALGLFYDFRELTPIGRRGDEMIRRLADRLVSVDLLDSAAELLQHQVDHRLQGAARSLVATRLAVIYLMNRKPDFALAALQRSRMSELSNELRDQRLLLEARALSDIGRHDVALEVVGSIKGREAIRLRADIEWAAKHWRAAAEQLELMLGDRWRNFTPLTDAERADILRAAIGYALADERIGLIRLREKYAAKMADGPDGRAFDVVSAPIGTDGPEFQNVARRIAATDTLEAFLRDLGTRYPDTAGKPAADAPPAEPKGEALPADKAPTGSIRSRPAQRRAP